MKRRRAIIIVLIAAVSAVGFYFLQNKTPEQLSSIKLGENIVKNAVINNDPLSIERMRAQSYPGSEITTVQTLPDESSYAQSIVSYQSEGLRINALLTVPSGNAPTGGWPAIIFNHGYIPPAEYRSDEKYVAYVDSLARNGYVVLKPDYRGHGLSEGKPEGAYFSPAYTVDVLNAVGAVKTLPYVNKDKIGMWGHSLGGNITQRAVTITSDIKAAVVWGGVVGSYNNLYSIWFNRRRTTNEASVQQQQQWRMTRSRYTELHGTPESNPEFWTAIDPIKHLKYFNTPIQLHHTRGDETVNYQLSEEFGKELEKAEKTHEVYLYEGDNHNINANFGVAMERSLEFFDKYLK